MRLSLETEESEPSGGESEFRGALETDNGTAPPFKYSFDFNTNQMKPSKVTASGEAKIIDSKNFPATPIATAIVKLKPCELRELHWHPNADE